MSAQTQEPKAGATTGLGEITLILERCEKPTPAGGISRFTQLRAFHAPTYHDGAREQMSMRVEPYIMVENFPTYLRMISREIERLLSAYTEKPPKPKYKPRTLEQFTRAMAALGMFNEQKGAAP